MRQAKASSGLPRVATRKELAALLGISLPTLYAWIDAGLPAIEYPTVDEDSGKRTGEWRFEVAAVVAWREWEAARLTKKHGIHYIRTVVLRTRIPPGGFR